MFWKMDSIKNVVVKGYCRLLKPFIIFSIIGHLCFCIRLFVERDYNWVHYVLSPFKGLLRYGCVAGNEPLWFLLSLFVIRVLYTLCANYKIHFVIVLFVTALVGFLCNLYAPITEPRYLGNVSTGLFFFTMGNWLSNRTLEVDGKIQFIIAITLILYIVYPSAVDLFYNKVLYGNYFIWMIHSVLCIITINYLFRRYPMIDVVGLKYVGRDSMIYFVIHRLIIYSVQSFFIYLGYGEINIPEFWTALILSIIILPVAAKYIKV